MKTLFTVFALTIVFFISAQCRNLQTIDSIVNSKIGENEPGLMVGIVKEGQIIYEKYLGLSSLQHQVKVTEKTPSNIASTAKQFTALMVLDLALREKLSLEDDIRKFLPQLYPEIKETIKIRHLLNHTSGIRDFYDLMSIQQNPWWQNEGLDNNDAIELLENQKDLGFKPGTKYVYSNSGYTILTKIIEKASREDFHDYSKTFFERLGMINTEFLKDYMLVIPNQALPYSDWGDGVWKQYPMMTNLYGDGFLFTTLKDQLIYEVAVQNAKSDQNELLINSQEPIPNSEIKSYGFGLELEERFDRTAVHHSGGTGSYHSQMLRFPEENLSIFVMSSNGKTWSGGIAYELAELLLAPKESQDRYAKDIEENYNYNNLNELVGTYKSPDFNLIKIKEQNGELTWQNGNNNAVELSLFKDNIFQFENNPKVKIGFYDNEMRLFFPSEKVTTYPKIPEQNLSHKDLLSFEGNYFSAELNTTFNIKVKNKKLYFKIQDRENDNEVELLNRNTLVAGSYFLEVERDQYNNVIAILLSTNRALYNRFDKSHM